MTRYLKIECSGRCTVLDLTTLEELQTALGGDLERLAMNGGADLYLDEDGKSKGLDLNPVARLLLGTSGTMLLPGDAVVGTVLLFGGVDEEGDDLDVPAATVGWLRSSNLTTFADDD